MKLHTLLISLIPVSEALVAQRATDASLAGFGVYTDSTHPVTGKAFQMMVKGYNGPVTSMDLANSTFVPSVHYLMPWERNLTSDGLEKRNVCQYLANCVQTGVETAALWTMETMEQSQISLDWFCNNAAQQMNTYLAADNYAKTNTVLQGSMVTVVWPIALTPVIYYMNAKLAHVNGTNKDSDTCGIRQAPNYASGAANSLYQFCKSTQNMAQPEIATRFSAADLANADSKNYTGGGVEAIAEFFIAKQADVFAEQCKDMRIMWRRGAQVNGSSLMAIEEF